MMNISRRKFIGLVPGAAAAMVVAPGIAEGAIKKTLTWWRGFTFSDAPEATVASRSTAMTFGEISEGAKRLWGQEVVAALRQKNFFLTEAWDGDHKGNQRGGRGHRP